MKPKKKEGVV